MPCGDVRDFVAQDDRQFRFVFNLHEDAPRNENESARRPCESSVTKSGARLNVIEKRAADCASSNRTDCCTINSGGWPVIPAFATGSIQ